MTVQECYEAIGGDYNDIMSRLKTEERVKKFAGMFLKEKCYQTLVQTIEEGNQEEAFRAAHTLKGVCQNIHSSFAITESLRGSNMDEAKTLLEQVTKDYERTIDGVTKLLEQ